MMYKSKVMYLLTIYRPMIYMAPNVMCLMGAWICPHQTHYIQVCINQRSIGNLMYMRGFRAHPPPSRPLCSKIVHSAIRLYTVR